MYKSITSAEEWYSVREDIERLKVGFPQHRRDLNIVLDNIQFFMTEASKLAVGLKRGQSPALLAKINACYLDANKVLKQFQTYYLILLLEKKHV